VWRPAILLALAACFAAPATFAGDKEKGKKDGGDKKEERKLNESAQAVADVAAAYQLAEFGRRNKAPELLIAAARVIGSTKFKDAPIGDKDKVSKPLKVDEVKEAEDLIAEALKMGKDSESIQALAKAAKAIIVEKGRSPWGGTRQWSGFFRGDGVDVRDRFHVDLRGGEDTCISLNGYGPRGLDLDLELYNASTGQLVASERSVGPNAFIRYYVPSSGTYRIEVINFTGRIPCDRYVLLAY